MAKVTTLNHEASAKGTKMYSQAEYAVAQALNTMRKESGSINSVVAAPTDKWKDEAVHVGSGFFTTDQMADNSMGEQYVKTASRTHYYDNMNMHDDIDLVLTSVYKVHNQYAVRGKGLTVSVKKMDRGITSGNISIELYSFNPTTKARREGWIKTGKSDYTAIALGTKFLIFSTAELKELVEYKKNVYVIHEHMTRERVEENEKQGRTYTDACNMMVPLADIRSLESCKEVSMPEWYTTKWKSKADAGLKAVEANLNK